MGKFTKKYTRKLEVQQRKAIRIIINSHYNTHTSHLFRSLYLLKLNDKYQQQLLKHMFSVTSSQLPQQLCDLFKANEATHPYNTRPNPQLCLPLYKKSICHKSFIKDQNCGSTYLLHYGKNISKEFLPQNRI